jgi:hypothetical protein
VEGEGGRHHSKGENGAAVGCVLCGGGGEFCAVLWA